MRLQLCRLGRLVDGREPAAPISRLDDSVRGCDPHTWQFGDVVDGRRVQI
jgi:hypothetical protein